MKTSLTYQPNCDDSPHTHIPDIAISINGAQKLFVTLDTKKATGPDNIPTYVLKLCVEEMVPVLTVIYTQSLNSGHIPRDWLTANVIPIFNKRGCSNPSNYRTISLMSVCCKLLEHIHTTYQSILKIIISNPKPPSCKKRVRPSKRLW